MSRKNLPKPQGKLLLIVYLNKEKGTKRTQKIRITIPDAFYKQGYDASWSYVDFYNAVLSSIQIIQGN